MNSVETTHFIEFLDFFFVKKMTVFGSAISCIRDQHATSVSRIHWYQIDPSSCLWNLSNTLNFVCSMEAPTLSVTYFAVA